MTKEELSQLIAIRDGAPNGATHHDSQATWKYKNLDKGTFFVDDSGTGYKINEFFPNESIRSLADINQLIEQEERIKELEQENLKCLGWIGQAMMRGLNDINYGDELIKLSQINNLNQQAKGIRDYVSEAMDHYFIYHLNSNISYHNFLIGLNRRAESLQNKARQLKDREHRED